jgi:hypothetical protein
VGIRGRRVVGIDVTTGRGFDLELTATAELKYAAPDWRNRLVQL